MVQQAMAGSASLGHHLRMISRTNLSDPAAIQRRATLGWEFFEQLFARLLKPLAGRRTHPQSFHCGMRLLGIDGSQYSLRNTARVQQMQRARPRNQHSEGAAFMKWSTAVLLELGTHQPLGIACSQAGLAREEGEIDIARRSLNCLPGTGPSLLLGDRLYGCASFILDVQSASAAATEVLMRVRSNVRGKLKQVLSDGTALVLASSEGKKRAGQPSTVLVREVRVQIARLGKAPPEVMRLWTTLLDARKHPAQSLVELYTQRWEQELFYRELKAHVAGASLLRAGSEQTAQTEFAAHILAASLVAQQRVQSASAEGALPVLRYSLGKIATLLHKMDFAMQIMGATLSERQRRKLHKEWIEIIARESKIPPRRSRSCQRGVRKRQSAWPVIRTRSNQAAKPVLSLIAYA